MGTVSKQQQHLYCDASCRVPYVIICPRTCRQKRTNNTKGTIHLWTYDFGAKGGLYTLLVADCSDVLCFLKLCWIIRLSTNSCNHKSEVFPIEHRTLGGFCPIEHLHYLSKVWGHSIVHPRITLKPKSCFIFQVSWIWSLQWFKKNSMWNGWSFHQALETATLVRIIGLLIQHYDVLIRPRSRCIIFCKIPWSPPITCCHSEFCRFCKWLRNWTWECWKMNLKMNPFRLYTYL